MPDYAPNFTARVKLIYEAEGDRHQCVTRWPSADTQAVNLSAAGTFWGDFLSQTADIRHESWEILSWEYCPADTNSFIPVTVALEPAAGTIATPSGPNTRIIATNWAGRSVAGAKTRFYVFGLRWNTADSVQYEDFIVTADEFADVGAVAGFISGSGMVGPDDETIGIVYPRATVKVNDAWVKIRRQGG